MSVERATVLDRAQAALDGGGGLVLTGHPGAGRSTLLSSLADRFTSGGHRVLRCRPARADQELPYLGLIDLLAEVADEELGRLPDAEHALLGGVLRRVTGATAPAGGGQLLTLRMALLRTLTELADGRPLLLVVDDAQWLDAPSADALSFVAHRSAGTGLAVAAAVRTGPVGGDDPVVRAVRLCPQPVTTLPVPPMTEPETAALLAEHGMAWPKQRASRIRRASGGNPRFALELARACGEDGGPVWDEPPTPTTVRPLPETLRAFFGRWLAALGPSARRTLLAAGTAARPTPELLLAAGFEGAAADLREAARLGLVEPVAQGPVRFTQPLTAALLYEEATPKERARIHRALADAATDPVERAHQLASLSRGKDPALAALLCEAAALARRRGDPAGAARLLLRAADHTPEDGAGGGSPGGGRGPGAGAVDLRLTAAEDALAAGDYPLVRRLAHRALRDCRTPADRVRAWMAVIDSSGQAVAEVSDVFRHALRDAEGEPGLLAQVHYRLAWRSWLAEGSAVRAHPHAVRAARLSGRAGDPRTHQLSLTLQSALEFYLGRPEAEETLDAALASPADQRVLYDHNGPAYLRHRRHLLHDRLDDAYTEMRALVYAVRRRGSPETLSQCLGCLALIEVHRGRCARALDLSRQGLRVAQDAGISQGPAWHAVAIARAAGGDLGDALSAAEQARRHSEDDDDRLFLPRALYAEGHIRLIGGEPRAAVRLLRRVRDLELAQGQGDPAMRRWQSDLAEALIGEGLLDEAAEVVGRTWKQAARLGRRSVMAALGRPRALLLEADGDPDAAVRVLRRTADQHQALRYPLEEGRARLALGQLHLRRCDAEAARRELAAAHRLFEQAQARPWLAQVRAAQERQTAADAPASASLAAVGSLTEAERRVARRVAQGASNREVAAELVVSVKTVEAALTRAYRKLGVRSRVDLTRAVLAAGAKRL
ncbi:ATP-binding protein [Streptomyces naganishii]|uniref:Transcriptional regulator n=1 Tax=Streptomyces naganishii JCM 4654 TaxID=1306179 RepID=A0A918Y3R3_9ACTN|nr:LuxR family transcriptional regulator [Streptomyces naganishii]GHD89007.1 transcriptional regulator [Streptomyces naganishii JCM 4654]